MNVLNKDFRFQTVIPWSKDQLCVICEKVAGIVDKLGEGKTMICIIW